jgi:hypothetical protein
MGSPGGRTRGENRQLITTVVTAIAEAEQVDADELAPLNDVVDGDALESIVQNSDGLVCVNFEYQQWLVTVRGEDDVEVKARIDDR